MVVVLVVNVKLGSDDSLEAAPLTSLALPRVSPLAAFGGLVSDHASPLPTQSVSRPTLSLHSHWPTGRTNGRTCLLILLSESMYGHLLFLPYGLLSMSGTMVPGRNSTVTCAVLTCTARNCSLLVPRDPLPREHPREQRFAQIKHVVVKVHDAEGHRLRDVGARGPYVLPPEEVEPHRALTHSSNAGLSRHAGDRFSRIRSMASWPVNGRPRISVSAVAATRDERFRPAWQ